MLGAGGRAAVGPAGWREAARGAVHVDHLVLPGKTVPARDQVVHECVRAVARAPLHGHVAAVGELVDVVPAPREISERRAVRS